MSEACRLLKVLEGEGYKPSPYHHLGTDSDITTCDQCGKTNLKGTVALDHDTQGIVHFGADCAARAMLGSNKASNKKIIQHQADAVALAKKAFAAGKDPKFVGELITNRIGYQSGPSKLEGAVEIQMGPTDAPQQPGSWDIVTVFNDGRVELKRIRDFKVVG